MDDAVKDDPETEFHICLFLPEIVNLSSSQVKQYILNLQKIIEDYPQDKLVVHILTYFLTGQCIKHFENTKEFSKIQMYTIFLNNELCQYHCLQSDMKVIRRPNF